MKTINTLTINIHDLYRYFTFELSRKKNAASKYIKYEQSNPGDYYSNNAFDYFGCIFVHIPKSAGISVTKSLFGNLAQGHQTIKYYQKKYHKYTYNSYYKFTIVRNPFDRLLSTFNFLKKGGMNEYDKAFSNKFLKEIDSFEKFVMHHLDKGFLMSHIHFYPQVYFLKDKDEKINLDFIGRFENLSQDFNIICENLEIDTVLIKINVGKQIKNSWETHYTRSMLNKIYDLYREDFDLLGYDPPS